MPALDRRAADGGQLRQLAETGGRGSAWQSSDWAERASCARCGSALFYRLVPTDEHFVALGAFDDQAGWRMAKQIFTDRRPAHYAFANRTEEMTEAEVIAASRDWEVH